MGGLTEDLFADIQTFEGSGKICALGDVNGDGHVNATDALCVVRIVAQLSSTAACPISPPGAGWNGFGSFSSQPKRCGKI